MKVSKKLIIFTLVLILAMSVFGLLIQAYYNAYYNSGGDCGTKSPAIPDPQEEEEGAKIAAKLWKQNISLGEYMEQVDPEFFYNLSEECKERYYSKPMNWPDIQQGY
ncbi:hypothetical protein [Methanoculleus bourgensis]|jgi:hypothetical protein|uniref:hypothetical protein n=1 Tax=Methanoculleus bourgensis TaxID=83986 RepID=UPI0007BCD48B|nr:hypothetical protein MBBA_0968 [Methanoculleus bourgensis]